MDKIIQLYPANENLHSSHYSLVDSPPKGYVLSKGNPSKKLIRKQIFKDILRKLNKHFKLNKFYNKLKPIPNFIDADIVLSLNQIYRGDAPWILDILDHATGITRYDYGEFVRKRLDTEHFLSSPNCKAIICENESSVEFMKRFFKKDIIKKIKLIRAATDLLPERSSKSRKKFRILFIGSLKNPKDFYFKGGMEAISAFEKLKNKEDCELILRCELPVELCDKVDKIHNIKVLKDRISRKELNKLYLNSDILLLPSHAYTLMSTLEAMSASLPVVGLKTWATTEYIKDGETGFLVNTSEKLREYYESEEYPTNVKTKEFYKKLMTPDTEVIKNLASKIDFLIENKSFKDNMGKNARKLFQRKFSLEERDKKLKEMFDEATRNVEDVC